MGAIAKLSQIRTLVAHCHNEPVTAMEIREDFGVAY